MELSEEQFHRYARHLILDEVGEEGQERLLQSKVLVIGAGGLGAPLMMYLAAAGVGTLGIVDDDEVDLTNLQRQVIHRTDRVGDQKVASAADTMPAPIIGGSGNLSPRTPTTKRNGMESRNISENISPACSWDIPFQTNISTECNEIVPQRLILSTEPANSIQ